VENLDSDINHKDITTLIKDGILRVVTRQGKDGKMELTYEVNNKSAWWKTHSINYSGFGLMGEYLEDFESIAEFVFYRMSKPMADVLSKQILRQADTMRYSIDAKSSETMRDSRNAQTSLIDKYLANKQERVLDIKGELKRSMMDMISGKEAHKATE
jgi:hypothetical protein